MQRIQFHENDTKELIWHAENFVLALQNSLPNIPTNDATLYGADVRELRMQNSAQNK